jgi:hypothetical protein
MYSVAVFIILVSVVVEDPWDVYVQYFCNEITGTL